MADITDTPFLDLARSTDISEYVGSDEPDCLVCANRIRRGDRHSSLLPRKFEGADVIAHGVCIHSLRLAIVESGAGKLLAHLIRGPHV